MQVEDAIRTRLSVREYADEPIDRSTQEAIVEAARLSQTGHNSQHWRFVLLDDDARLQELAELTRTGTWLADAGLGVVVSTDPERPYHEIDAGRAVTQMQLLAWAKGIGSCICTGYDPAGIRDYLDVPDDRAIPAVVGFGHPRFDVESLRGRKDRAALSEIAFRDRFGEPLE